MSNIKKIIKKILPDKLIYDYRIIQILPQYIRSKHKAAKISIGNDLFDNALSIKRIICPAENAFESLEKIEESIKKMYQRTLLCLQLWDRPLRF